MDISIVAQNKEPRKFTHPLLRAAEHKVEIEKILRQCDELAFRIEMARMSGLAREIDKFREQSEAVPIFLRLLVRDLKQLAKVAPNQAAILRDRLIDAVQDKDQTTSFKVAIRADQNAHLSTLAVR